MKHMPSVILLLAAPFFAAGLQIGKPTDMVQPIQSSVLLIPLRRTYRSVDLSVIRDFSVELGKGALGGYGSFAAVAYLRACFSGIIRRLSAYFHRQKTFMPMPVNSTGTVAGRWVLDGARSESMEPFLVSVGAPRLVARMVGKKGKPVVIDIAENGAVTVHVEGKEAERFTSTPTELTTPKGSVLATLVASAGKGAFTITKQGPAEGEVTTEVRELVEDADTMRMTLSHRNPVDGMTVFCVRYYRRAIGG
jgi:hypothetical protein